MIGVIKQLKEKRFGFIKSKGHENDIFFHVSGLRPNMQWEDLKIDMKVKFEIEQTPKGNKAVEISPA